MNNFNSQVNYNSANDFLNDAGFINFHFRLDARDEFRWHNWIENHPDKVAIVNEARGILNMLSFSIPDDEYDSELEKIKFAINRRADAKQSKSLFRLPQHSRLVKLTAAAAVLVLVISGVLMMNYFTSDKQELTVRHNNSNTVLRLTLEDNSKVMLTPGSSLSYPAFSANERDVFLTGGANFEVTDRKNAPFTVFAGKIVATVLGTVFDIKTKNDSSAIVDLKTGSLKVSVAGNGTAVQELLLEPGQSAVFNNNELVKVDKRSSSVAAKDSVRHDIEFRRNDFVQIADMIRKTYGIVLINESGSNNWKFSGQFKNSTAHEIIESICLIKGLTTSVKGDTIVIR